MEIHYIGFIKAYDTNICTAKSLSEMLMPHKVEIESKDSIINYLSSGIFLCGAMSYIYDEENNPIGDLNYYTDGVFIWPSYYLYYMRKYDNLEINKDFIEHARRNNFVINGLSKKQLVDLENLFLLEWAKRKINSR